jgi:hypothetical protein
MRDEEVLHPNQNLQFEFSKLCTLHIEMIHLPDRLSAKSFHATERHLDKAMRTKE